MPCRALEAFRQKSGIPLHRRYKMMGLNALSGIGGVQTIASHPSGFRRVPSCLNALSGIGGVQTMLSERLGVALLLRLNALSGIGGVQTQPPGTLYPGSSMKGLNALSGIGGVQTQTRSFPSGPAPRRWVLMPCRALEAFRPRAWWNTSLWSDWSLCLNALSGIGGVQTGLWGGSERHSRPSS